MGTYRRHLRRLNGARTVAVTTLLVALFCIELLFQPERSLWSLYMLAAGAFATILLYALLDRRFGDRPLLAGLQVSGDLLLAIGFVYVTGGAASPLSFLLAVPVMTAAALLGLRGALWAAIGAWGLYAGLLVWQCWRLGPELLPPGRALYAALSHLIGFIVLGALGGLLADRLTSTDRELHRRRQDLEALRALHADIVQSISAGLVTTDPAGRVTFVNRAAEEILGFTADQLIGRPAELLFGLDSGFLGEAPPCGTGTKRPRFERAWRRESDGKRLLLGMSISELKGHDNLLEGWLVLFQDLTEIASLEEQVRIKERMAALGEMAAGMAHELRNPLAALSGCVQILAQHANTDGRNLSDVALRESERLNRIISDFLDFARPGPCRPRPIDLVPLMQEMSRLLYKSPDVLPQHQIEVQVGAGPSWALADPDRMRQVFWNLASNALKAMPCGGTLTIGIVPHGSGAVMLSFRDQGQGMDPETLKRYFQPFHSKFREGSGLGAAIVYRIAQEHGGSVQVISHEGQGTDIRLIMPAASAPHTVQLPTTSAAAS